MNIGIVSSKDPKISRALWEDARGAPRWPAWEVSFTVVLGMVAIVSRRRHSNTRIKAYDFERDAEFFGDAVGDVADVHQARHLRHRIQRQLFG